MTTTDYLINFALIALVLLQVRDNRLTIRSLLRPVLFVAAAAFYYLKGLPTAGNDMELYAAFIAAGVGFGFLNGLTTHVWRAIDGFVHTKAGIAAATFWVLGIGGILLVARVVLFSWLRRRRFRRSPPGAHPGPSRDS